MGKPVGTVVLKVGGAVADDGGGALGGAVALWRAGQAVVLVHGGGPEITRWSARMGLEARFVSGLRYSDPETVAVAVDARAACLVALCAIDNLGKGAAGAAIQNMNVMCGLEETAGLPRVGLYP